MKYNNGSISFPLSLITSFLLVLFVLTNCGRGSNNQNFELKSGSRTTTPKLINVPSTNSPGLQRQTDKWSCGAHVAARILKFYGHNVSYDTMKARRLQLGPHSLDNSFNNFTSRMGGNVGEVVGNRIEEALRRRLSGDNGGGSVNLGGLWGRRVGANVANNMGLNPSGNQGLSQFYNQAKSYVGNNGLVRAFGTTGEEEQLLLQPYLGNRVKLTERSNFYSLKQKLAQNKPVIVLLKNGPKQIKLTNSYRATINYYHWVVAIGYDDRNQKITIADSYFDRPQELTYHSFQSRWETEEKNFFFKVGTKLFVTPRTMLWVDSV